MSSEAQPVLNPEAIELKQPQYMQVIRPEYPPDRHYIGQVGLVTDFSPNAGAEWVRLRMPDGQDVTFVTGEKPEAGPCHYRADCGLEKRTTLVGSQTMMLLMGWNGSAFAEAEHFQQDKPVPEQCRSCANLRDDPQHVWPRGNAFDAAVRLRNCTVFKLVTP